MKTLTYTKKDFAWTQWSPADIKKVAEDIITHKKKCYAKIKKIPAQERTFENTIYAIEASDYGVGEKASKMYFLMEVSPRKSVRESARNAVLALGKEMVDIEYDKKLYEAVKEYDLNKKIKKEKLSGADEKLFKDMMRGYRRMGFELSGKKRKELKNIIKKLNKFGTHFSNNINDYKDHITVTKEELSGLPENYIKGLKKDKKGKYIITLDYPDIGPFLAKSNSAEKRKELTDKNLRKGGLRNMKILQEVLVLRHRKACLLGYKHHADYVTEERMVKSTKKASNFVLGLIKKVREAALNDVHKIAKLKKEKEGEKLHYYDIAYYSDQLMQKNFSLDTEKIREYFPIEHVKKSIFKIYSKLFSISFHKLSGFPSFHKDVEFYVIKENKKVIAYFLLDLYPRVGKYGHAAEFSLIQGRFNKYKGNTYVAPIGALVMNLPKANDNNPSLISHSEVETFFHEFGHLMHHSITRSPYASQSGTSVTRDFVEAPSQMLEHWVEDKKMLHVLSSHYKTKKKLPNKMIDNILKAKFHQIYHSTMRQLIFAEFDLLLHSKPVKNTSLLFRKLVKKNTGVLLPKNQIFPAGFGHLFGYDAGYYSYMWSKVFADDMFTRFKRAGLLDNKVGMKYRKEILEVGSSRDEMESVKKFLGRKPNNKAFLKEIGL